MNPNVQASVAQEVNTRLEKATAELKAKYEAGDVSVEESVNAPTGDAYRAAYDEQRKLRLANKQRESDREERLAEKQKQREKLDAAGASDSEGDDDDEEIRALREKRLKQLQSMRNQQLENIAKGHGQFREIGQDQFINEVTGSGRVIALFYHADFARSDIMQMHLSRLATHHIEAKFIKIDASKAPFFIDKLKIRTIPTTVIFIDGIATDKILGFEGLADDQPAGKEDEWSTPKLAHLLAEKGAITKSRIVDEEARERDAQAKVEALRQQFIKESMLAMSDSDSD